MERETGFEPATSSLGIQTYVKSKSLARFCRDFLNLQHLAESAFSESVTPNEAQMRQVFRQRMDIWRWVWRGSATWKSTMAQGIKGSLQTIGVLTRVFFGELQKDPMWESLCLGGPALRGPSKQIQKERLAGRFIPGWIANSPCLNRPICG